MAGTESLFIFNLSTDDEMNDSYHTSNARYGADHSLHSTQLSKPQLALHCFRNHGSSASCTSTSNSRWTFSKQTSLTCSPLSSLVNRCLRWNRPIFSATAVWLTVSGGQHHTRKIDN